MNLYLIGLFITLILLIAANYHFHWVTKKLLEELQDDGSLAPCMITMIIIIIAYPLTFPLTLLVAIGYIVYKKFIPDK